MQTGAKRGSRKQFTLNLTPPPHTHKNTWLRIQTELIGSKTRIRIRPVRKKSQLIVPSLSELISKFENYRKKCVWIETVSQPLEETGLISELKKNPDRGPQPWFEDIAYKNVIHN